MNKPSNSSKHADTHKAEANSEASVPVHLFLKKTLKILFIASLSSIAALLLLIILSISMLLGSQDTREWFVEDIASQILTTNSTQVYIQGFHSPSFGSWYFEALILKLNNKTLFEANKLLLNFDTGMLLDKQLDVIELSANKLFIEIPETETTDNNINESSTLNWQQFMVPIRLQKLDLSLVEIIDSNIHIPAFQLHGESSFLWETIFFQSALFLKTKSQQETKINFQASIDENLSGTLLAKIQEEANGWLGSIIKLPQTEAVNFNLALKALRDKETVYWELESFDMPWKSHKIQALGQGSWQTDNHTLKLAQLSLFVDDKKQTFNGWWQDNTFALEASLENLPIDLADPFQNYISGGYITGSLNASGDISKPSFKTNLVAQTRYNKQAIKFDIKGEGNLNTFNIEHALVNLGDAEAETRGSIFIDTQALDLEILKLSGPVRIIETFDIDFPNELFIDIKHAEGSLKGSFSAPKYAGFTEAFGQYKEQKFELQSSFKGDVDKVNITNFLANVSGSEIKADGLINWGNEFLDLKLQTGKLPIDLIKLVNVNLPKELSVELNSDFKVTGSFHQPIFEGIALADGFFRQQSFAIETGFIADIEKVELKGLSASIDKGHIKTDGAIEWKNEQLDLTVDSNNLPLSLLTLATKDFPDNIEGEVNAKGTLKGPFSLPSFNGSASTNFDFQKTHYEVESTLEVNPEHLDIKSFLSKITFFDSDNKSHDSSINAHGRYTFSTKELNGRLSIHTLPYQIIELFDMKLPPTLSGNIDTNLSISGELPFPSLQGSIQSTGLFQKEPFHLNFEGSQKDHSIFFDDTSIKWHDTTLSANGLISKDNLDLQVSLQELKLTDLNTFGFDLKPGKVDLNFNLLGSAESPELNGVIKLTVNKQIHLDDIRAPLEDIVVTTTLMTDSNLLTVNSDVRHGQEDKGNLQIKSTYKTFVDSLLKDLNTQKMADIPLNIDVSGNVGLNWINNFIDRDIQNISGELTLNTQLHGSLNKPRINGSLELINGKYINALSQTSIENAQIQLGFDEQSISIIKAVASDGHKGTLSLHGKASLADNDNGHIDISLNLNKASLVRREDIEGDATGMLKLTGDLKEMVVSGDIDVSPFQIMLDLIPTDSIPEIDVNIKESVDKPAKNKINLPPVLFKINVSVEQQAYIRGRGLDAELKGKLSLSGTTTKPNYNGQFSVVRGTFELFAKTFKLEEGDVLFSNDAVSLFVQGRHKGKDITFIASLSGTLDDLKISLRTEPTLPEDEALARLLFGKSVRNITPVQAIQLASAIQTLRGEGSSFDPLGKARDLFHVDNISVESQESSDGNGVAVGIGKYLTDGVYVELARTPDPAQPWKGSVEVELTPNINLETTTGGRSGFGGVELQWKKDY